MSRFFRAEPPSPASVETQVAALELGSPEFIIATALGDGEEALRAAAVRKLPDGEALRNIAGLADGASPPASSSLEAIAQARVADLIDARAIDFAALCAAAANPSAVLAVAGLCSNPEMLPQALAMTQDPQRLALLVIEGSSSRLRQLAAQRIEDPAQLKQLLKDLRGKDKSVFKIIKQKCDVLRTAETRGAQIESEAIAACESLERHSHRIYEVIYEPSFRHFDTRWQSLEAQAAPEIRERARLAIDRCREIIAKHHRKIEEQAAQQSHQAALRAARDAAGARAAEDAERRNEDMARAAAEATAAREAEEKARAEKLAAEALALRQLGGLLAKTHGALREGNTSRAAGLRRAIEEKLPAVPAMPAHMASQVQQLDVKLNELKEWKDFAVAPKRAELIVEMESLIGSPEKPKVLADRIKYLQEQWKTISKGIVVDSGEDWQRFHQASVTAYQPCREYFEAQAKQRQQNVEKRKGVLERLRAFEGAQSGEQPDWRAVSAALREAPRELHRYTPVDRAAGNAVQEEFDAVIGRLQARLDAWQAQNAAEKQTLIERARHLITKEDGREAVEGVKRLQLQWKDVGPAQHHQEQQLWSEFRQQCDAVFQRREQAYAEHAAGLEANKAQAVALCVEVEQLAALAGPALLESAAKILEWRAAFEALGEMPRAVERTIHGRFERAVNHCQTQVSQQRAREKEQSVMNLFEAARLIHAYGWAVAQGADADRDALKTAAEKFIAGVPSWPKGGAQALNEAWAKAHSVDAITLAAEETALRMLCIRSEILADQPTPEEDQALRREHQVHRLLKHMGQGGEAHADDFAALALEWVRVGPVAAATHQSLLARFLRCRAGGGIR